MTERVPVYLVTMSDTRWKDGGRQPLAICASEAAAVATAEAHELRGRRAPGRWTRPTNRGQVIAALWAGFGKEYEVWRFTLVEEVDPALAEPGIAREDLPRLLREAQERARRAGEDV